MKIRDKKKFISVITIAGFMLSAGVIFGVNGWFGSGGSISEDTFTRGLFGYWAFDEGRGFVAYDACVFSNDGTFGTYMATGTPWTTGKVGGALQFDGGDDTVKIPHDAVFNFGTDGDFAIEMWINSTIINNIRLFYKSSQLAIVGPNATGKLWFRVRQDDSNYSIIESSVTISTGEFIHIICLRSGESLELYINGVKDPNPTVTNVGVGVNSDVDSVADIYIASEAGSYNFWNGIVDEVKIYNRALSEEEARYHYNRGGPVGHWKFDEGSGSTAYDSTDNDNDGTLTWMSTSTQGGWTEGKYGSALSFDGTDDYVGNSSYDWSLVDEITIAAWFKTSDTVGAIVDIFRDGYTIGAANLMIDSGNALWGSIYAGGCSYPANRYRVDSAVTVNDNNWHYGVFTYDGANLKIYVDGVHRATNSNPTGDVCDDYNGWSIGANRQDDPADFFSGLIDDVRIYNYARTPEEIRLDYNAGFGAKFGYSAGTCERDPGACMDLGLVGYWDMEEGTGTIVKDKSDNSNNGAITEALWGSGIVPLSGGKSGGGGLEFDGSDDYVNFGNPVSLQITDELTIEYWVKFNSTQVSAQFANPIGKDHSGTEGVTLQIDHTDVVAPYSQYWHVGHGTGLYSLNYSATTLLDDTWHHLVLTKSLTAGMAIYLDGAVVSSNAAYTKAIVYDTSNWNFGREPTIPTRITKMIGDEIRFYNRALSAEEIRYHYNRGGPVAHWKMDEGSGSTAYDSTENNNDGTLYGEMATSTTHGWTTGKHGSALSFDGTDDYVIRADQGSSDPLRVSGDLTIEAWIKPNDVVNILKIVEKYQTEGGYSLMIHSTSKFRFDYSNGSQTSLYSALTPSVGTWYHVVGTYDGATMKLYINGLLDNSVAETGYANSSQVFTIGSQNDPPYGQNFNGIIDDVRIYNYARTPDEIRLDYNAGFAARFGPTSTCDKDPGSCMTEGLVGHWSFEEGNGTTVYDASDYSNNGTFSTYMATSTNSWAGGTIPLSGGKSGGGALQFDGDDDFIEVPYNASLNITSAITVEAWVKPNTGYGQTFPRILQKDDGKPIKWVLGAGSGAFDTNLYINSVQRQFTAVSTIPANQWTHIMTTYDGTTNKIYINGVLDIQDSSYPGTIDSATGSLYFGDTGGGAGGGTRHYDGSVDEVRIYNRALSAEEIRYHYNRGKPVGHWKLDEGSGSTTYDSTENNSDGTLYGEMATSTASDSGWAAGKYGSALAFDGTDDYVSISSPGALTSLTISTWAYYHQAAIDQSIFESTTVSEPRHTSVRSNGFEIQPDGVAFGDRCWISTGAQTANTWHHLVLTWDGTTGKGYLDNKLIGTCAITGTLDANATYAIGRHGGNSEWYMDGLIDDVRIYNYVRSSEQIRQDHNAGFSTHFK